MDDYVYFCLTVARLLQHISLQSIISQTAVYLCHCSASYPKLQHVSLHCIISSTAFCSICESLQCIPWLQHVSLQVPTVCVLVSSVLRLLVYTGMCDMEELDTLPCSILKSTHEGGNSQIIRVDNNHLKKIPVTYHLIFAITGVVFCCLNSVINISFYCVQSKVKSNNIFALTLPQKTIF